MRGQCAIGERPRMPWSFLTAPSWGRTAWKPSLQYARTAFFTRWRVGLHPDRAGEEPGEQTVPRMQCGAFRIAACVAVALLSAATVSYAAHYRVVLLGGQSNMDGRGDTAGLPAQLQLPQTNVLFYHGQSGRSIPANTWTNLAPGSGTDFGPEVTFGRTVADAFPTGHLALVKYASGGTDLENDWDPASGGVYTTFRNVVTGATNALTAAGHTFDFTAMLWTQGERDARNGRTQVQYEADLTEFIADVRARYGAALPFFVSQLSSDQTNLPAAGLAAIRAAQANIAAADPDTVMTVTDTFGLMTDNLHFNTDGQKSLGQALGTAFADFVRGASASLHFTGIQVSNVTATSVCASATVSTSADAVYLLGDTTDHGEAIGSWSLTNVLGSAAAGAQVEGRFIDLAPNTTYALRFWATNTSLGTQAWSAPVSVKTAVAQPETSNPIAHYAFDTDFRDSSGNGNALAIGSGSPSITTNAGEHCFGGGALDLASTISDQSYLSPATSFVFAADQPWSVAFWGRRRPGTDKRTGMVVGNVGNRNDFIWTPNNSSVVQGLRFRNSSGGNADFAGISDDHQFHHWVVVADGEGNVTAYRDNTPLGAQARATTFLIDGVGHAYNSTIHSYDGQIDELYIFDESIDPNTIDLLYRTNGEAPPKGTLLLVR